MKNYTLTTSYQQVHDGKTLAHVYCTSAVLYAASDSPASDAIATWPAAVPTHLPMNTVTYAKVAASTATLQIIE